MKKQFLGDVFDHWKGCLIELLLQERLILDLAIEPMITDVNPWSEGDLKTYKKLLKVSSNTLICHHNQIFEGPRRDYFNRIQHSGDIFFDPDTGIATGSAKRKHIKITEIDDLLNSNRLFLVYQHSAHGSFHIRLQLIGNQLKKSIQNVCLCVYECGQVAMFFISLDEERLSKIQESLRTFLSGTAASRIWMMI